MYYKKQFSTKDVLLHGGKLDIQKFSTNLPGLPWAKYSGEKHLFGHNFTGPGTNLDKRLNDDDEPVSNSKPINRIDEAALKHDIFYRDHSDIKERHQADLEMIEELNNIKNPTFREKVERVIVIKMLKAKMKLGMGIADELHKEFRKPNHLLKVKVFNKDDIWSADLVEMPPQIGKQHRKYKYILTVIDLYTRYAWAIPLPNKQGITVKEAFQQIIKETKRKPNKLWVDQGKEFYNKDVKTLDFDLYSTHNDGKAVVIERFNRTLKQMMYKKFTEQGNQKWLTLLPELMQKYNNKIHRSINTTPAKASSNPDSIKIEINKDNYTNEMNSKLVKNKPKFKVHDRVRIFKYKSMFAKGYTAKWTNEIFVIDEVLPTVPYTYKLKDLEDEEIIGSFYENELEKTDF